MKQQVAIIGFGRFGQTLYRLMHEDFRISVFTRSKVSPETRVMYPKAAFTSVDTTAYKADIILYAVPISQFESVIESQHHLFEPRHVLIDVLSVKVLPSKVLLKYIQGTLVQAINTHPMFGPDSSRESFLNLPIVMHKLQAKAATYNFWTDYFKQKGLQVIELTPSEHDKLAANSQGLTHFIGRLLEEYGVEASPIDTLGTQKLLAIEQQTANDTWQLFNDLQHYNPYTKDMRLKLGRSYDIIYNKLLPPQLHQNYLTIGIQGGKGSFNEEALQYWLLRSNIKDYKIIYLYTTRRVLSALHAGEIDRGQFAIHNSVGGIVNESITAMASFKFQIVEEFAIKISHALMIRDDADYQSITSIMAHPQVFAQCKNSLYQKYPHLKLTSGTGDLIDHANVARQLSLHKLPKNIATMGSKVLATLYNLKVIEDNLQDANENYTSFLMVKR